MMNGIINLSANESDFVQEICRNLNDDDDNEQTGKRQDWESHSSTAEGSSLLGCDTVLLSQQFLIFQRTALHSTSRTSIHCLVFESEGITMIQNVGSCEETFPLGLHGPADEDNTILHGYLPTDIALYTGRPESFFKGGGGSSKLCNYTL